MPATTRDGDDGMANEDRSAPGMDESGEIADLRADIALRVATGYDAHDAIREYAIQAASDADMGLDDAIVGTMVLEEMRRHAIAEAAWPATTDNDRLDAAFTAMEADGIVCRQNFACCQTCGNAEIWEDMEAIGDKGVRVDGYAFFHQQDADSAAEGGGVYLAYGANVERYDEKAAERVATRIVRSLGEYDLKSSWSGSAAARIIVHLEWRRRRAAMDEAVLAA